MTIAGGCLMTTLAALRERARLTQSQVAALMGVDRSRVSRIEAQYPDVPFPSLQAYLKAIGEDVLFTRGHETVSAGTVVADPERKAALERRRNEPGRKKL